PAPPVEMTDGVRRDFMPVAMQRVHEGDAPSHIVGRTTEIDARDAAGLVRTLIKTPFRVGEEVDATDKEGETDAFAAAIEFAREFRPFLPALDLGAIVESDRHELRWALRCGSSLRTDD